MKYPKLGDYRKPKPNSGRKCAICGHSPAGLLDIEVNWFRGDDLTVACCQNRECRRDSLDAAKRS